MNTEKSNYLDALVEAQLDGRDLPEPQTDEEREQRAVFDETQDIFASYDTGFSMHQGWEADVWSRVDTLADDTSRDAEQDAAPPAEPPETGQVIDASARFRRWSTVIGIVAAAAAVLILIPVFMMGRDDMASQEASSVQDKSAEEAPVASSAPGDGDQVMAKLQNAEKAGSQPERRARPAAEPAAPPPVERPTGAAGAVTETAEALEEEAGEGFGRAGGGPGKKTKAKEGKWDKGLSDDTIARDKDWDKRPDNKPAPRLTAGETDDNDNFEAFQKFLAERPKPYLEEMDVSERMFIRVLDAKNRPLPNTTVTFKASGQNVFTGKTYADGSVLFHPRSFAAAAQAQSFDLTFQHGSTALDYTIKRGAKESWEVRMPLERSLPARPQVDVVFLLDTTGSMGDEIERLQQTILQISDQVSNLQGNPEPRFGLVLYRDDGEEYVSQLHDFTPDVNTFKRTLSAVTADGGGDTPERLEVGLHRTVHEMSWGAQSTRLVFLVADAPPHRADQNEHSYARDIQAAVGKGIKVYPVASSGLNDDGEYVLRQLAQYTMAKFLFLTYGASGTFTPHDIPKDSFQPTTLDGLIIKIIRTEIQALQLDKGGISQQ